jgi:antitoxin HicB
MFEMRYPANIRQDPEGKDWVIRFRDLDGALTGAATFEEALDEAADCVGSWLAFRMLDKGEIPRSSAPKRKEFLISVPLWIAPKVALYRELAAQGLSNSELARRLKVRETVVRRMLDPDHATKPAKIEAALRAVGKRLLVAVDDAA